MPPIVIDSLDAFCAWLHGSVTSAIPLGLSLRLRPLRTPSQGIDSSSIVLVRPHCGHVLLSLQSNRDRSHQGSSGSGGGGDGDDAKRNKNETDGGEAAVGVASYAGLLQTLLHVTNTAGTHLVSSSCYHNDYGSGDDTVVFCSAAVDGAGRKVMLFAALLRHCAPWWAQASDAGTRGGLHFQQSRGHNISVKAPLPFLFFDAVGISSPLHTSDAVLQHNQRLGFLRALRRLAERGGWRLALRPSPPASADGATTLYEADWLDCAVACAVGTQLQPSGDYCTLLVSATTPSTCADGAPCEEGGTPNASAHTGESLVVMAAARAVLWHVLAAEMDRETVHILCDLVVQFINASASVDAVADSSAKERRDVCVCRQPVHIVRSALRRLVSYPAGAFACPAAVSSSGSNNSAVAAGRPSRASAPSPRGPLRLSRVLPPEVHVLLLPEESGGSAASATSQTPRFFLQALRAASNLEGKPLRVLMLRVDPEGEWLPLPEEIASRRSYYASFQQQQQRARAGGHARFSESPIDSESSDDDERSRRREGEVQRRPRSFAEMEARSAGTRAVLHATPPVSEPTAALPPFFSQTEGSSAEDTFISFLAFYTMRQPPFASIAATVSAKEQLLWSATVRLYTYALLHSVRVILTPEKLPAFTKAFGYRHLPQLHRALQAVKQLWDSGKQQEPPSTSSMPPVVTQQVATDRNAALLAALCARNVPIAVYVVDQASLHGFHQLQTRRDEVCLPLVLCRSTLRLPEHSSSRPLLSSAPPPPPPTPPATTTTAAGGVKVETSSAEAPPPPLGVLAVTHCAVLGDRAVCEAWAACPPQSSAAALMESCRGAEQSTRRDEQIVCVLALASCPPPVLSPPSVPCARHRNAAADVASTTETADPTADAPARPGGPSLLLVAPTPVLAAHYAELMRKAAAALLEALTADPSPPHQIESGLVRGGGAFYVALAKQLHLLLCELDAPKTAVPSCSSSSSVVLSPSVQGQGMVCESQQLPHQERRWVRYLLYLVAEACAAVATKHAEPVVARHCADTTAMTAAQRAWTCGPLARRRLWVEALRAYVHPSSTASLLGQPVLHVEHDDGRGVVRRSEGWGDGVGEGAEPYAVAMRVFCVSRYSPASCAECCRDERRHHRHDDDDDAPFLWEPLATNVRCLREALSMLLLSLSTAA